MSGRGTCATGAASSRRAVSYRPQSCQDPSIRGSTSTPKTCEHNVKNITLKWVVGGGKRGTHDACEFPLELFYNGGEAPACEVEESPRLPHRFAVPSRGFNVPGSGDVALVVPHPVLEEDAELYGMGQEQREC